MYIRRKVFSCVEERSFAEEQKDDKKKDWSLLDEEYAKVQKKWDKTRERERKAVGGILGGFGGMAIPGTISDISSNAKVRKAANYAILPAAAVGSYVGYKAGKKYHDKKSSLKADLERYEQLSTRDREAYRQMKDREKFLQWRAL